MADTVTIHNDRSHGTTVITGENPAVSVQIVKPVKMVEISPGTFIHVPEDEETSAKPSEVVVNNEPKSLDGKSPLASEGTSEESQLPLPVADTEPPSPEFK